MTKTSERKKTAVLFNPSAGGGRAAGQRDLLQARLTHHAVAYDLYVTESGEDLSQKTKGLAASYSRLVGAGGDSTFFLMINALMQVDIRPEVGLVGLGSSNDIPLHFGIETVDKACRAIKHDSARPVDLGCFSGEGGCRYFLGQANIGLGVAVNRFVARLNRRHPFLGKKQSLAGTLGILDAYVRRNSSVPLRIRWESPGEKVSKEEDPLSNRKEEGSAPDRSGPKEVLWTVALFSNIRYWATGKLMCPRADAEDGLLDACLIESCGFRHLARINRRASGGTHEESSMIHSVQAASFDISSGTPFAVQLDGEVVGGPVSSELFTSAEICAVPSALRLLLP